MPMTIREQIKERLDRSRLAAFSIYAIFAAFFTYFCMYAFRKPFTVGTFDGTVIIPFVGAVDYKIALIIAQVFGYTLSKFYGIKFVSEIMANRRAAAIMALIVLAELALLGFALTPKPYSLFFIFMNGLPLGMVWGLVFAYLEGRRVTELLGAGLSASYIVSSGVVKTAGKLVLDFGVPETWMPFVTGLFFLPLLALFVFLLDMVPPPNAEDEKLRMKRQPMDGEQRRVFFLRYAPGIVCLTLLYMFLTAYRDFRDNFAREIWDALGFGDQPLIFTYSEIPITLVVLVILSLVMIIRNNRKALFTIMAMMTAGSVLIGASTLAFQLNLISPAAWMILVGLGLYLGYVPYGCILFERLIAAVGFIGTAGFLIYVSDAFGYLGSVALLLYKNFGSPELSWLRFFINISYVTALVSVVFFLISLAYFRCRISRGEMQDREAVGAGVTDQPG